MERNSIPLTSKLRKIGRRTCLQPSRESFSTDSQALKFSVNWIVAHSKFLKSFDGAATSPRVIGTHFILRASFNYGQAPSISGTAQSVRIPCEGRRPTSDSALRLERMGRNVSARQ